MNNSDGKIKWLTAVLGFIVALSIFLVGINRVAISELPEKYVRLERYKSDIQDIKSSLKTISRKIDEIRR